MLRALNLKDFVIVDHAELEFSDGFTVLSGETGAGKSILVDALAMVLGERGDAGVVRQGTERADISAEFDVSKLAPLRRWLSENDLTGDDDTCLMRRVIDSKGRSRSFVNGRNVTLAQLREAGEQLVDIHGQHEHQSLLRPAAQRELLDGYAGLEEQAKMVSTAWRTWQDLRRQRTMLETNAAALAAERDELQSQVSELEALAFRADEWQELQAEHARLAHAQSLIEGSQFAIDLLLERDIASVAQLATVSSRLQRMLEYDERLKDIVEIVSSAQAQAQEAGYMLRDYQQRLELDPRRAAEVEQRLEAVHGSARKYRVMPEMLPDILERARARLAEMGASGDLNAMRARESAAAGEFTTQAAQLGAARKKAANRLSHKVTEAMQALALAGSSFEVALTPLQDSTSHGIEQIEFMVSAHKGLAARPLARVASGGELSRISLAIQSVTSTVAQVPTLIFDEVDAGIGGRVAEIVGQTLKRLGSKHQVMCVTHLPQVAAAADHQWQVARSALNGGVASHVTVLGEQQRVEEIARMLGGIKITETTRRHAAEMLGLKV